MGVFNISEVEEIMHDAVVVEVVNSSIVIFNINFDGNLKKNTCNLYKVRKHEDFKDGSLLDTALLKIILPVDLKVKLQLITERRRLSKENNEYLVIVFTDINKASVNSFLIDSTENIKIKFLKVYFKKIFKLLFQ